MHGWMKAAASVTFRSIELSNTAISGSVLAHEGLVFKIYQCALDCACRLYLSCNWMSCAALLLHVIYIHDMT